ncbi:MAG: hypothetical protein PHD06_12435 [Bacteroidales bacterium]|nr:hypothetical protein [Bacteroidales bacterium]MDD4385973.1 hypothetical protein [Bacteroidales bacterium]MDY0198509.1 hypothetical protein [Tenuifilaceae bacterium]
MMVSLEGTARISGGENKVEKATAEDIVGAMLYFAVPISGWVSGKTIFVNS